MNRRDFVKFGAAAPVMTGVAANAIANSEKPTKVIPFSNTEKYWDQIRAQFPITKGALYFNNGTMGPSPKYASDVVAKQMMHVDATGDYGYDRDSVLAAIGRVLNADEDDIALTHNVSEGISIIASGLRMQTGDEVILTDQEHGGGAVPWLVRAKRHGIVVKFVELHPDDNIIIERFEKAMTKRTKIIAVPHLTCTTGQLLPVKRLAELAHSKGAYLFVDGAHPPGMLQVDVADIGCDAYASCGHKWLLGPKGTGFLYITKNFSEEVMPSWSGAEADMQWDYNGNLELLPTASKYDFGTQNSALYIGLKSAIEWEETIGFANIEARVKQLTGILRNGLLALAPGKFEFLTPTTSITGITTIRLSNADRYRDLANALQSKYKLRTRVVPESSLNANRFSVHVYTSRKDIETFLKGIQEVLLTV